MEQLSPPSLTPAFFKILSSKHHFVKLDCIKLTATNAVNKKKYSLKKYPKIIEIKTKLPAIILIELLIVICYLIGML